MRNCAPLSHGDETSLRGAAWKQHGVEAEAAFCNRAIGAKHGSPTTVLVIKHTNIPPFAYQIPVKRDRKIILYSFKYSRREAKRVPDLALLVGNLREGPQRPLRLDGRVAYREDLLHAGHAQPRVHDYSPPFLLQLLHLLHDLHRDQAGRPHHEAERKPGAVRQSTTRVIHGLHRRVEKELHLVCQDDDPTASKAASGSSCGMTRDLTLL